MRRGARGEKPADRDERGRVSIPKGTEGPVLSIIIYRARHFSQRAFAPSRPLSLAAVAAGINRDTRYADTICEL